MRTGRSRRAFSVALQVGIIQQFGKDYGSAYTALAARIAAAQQQLIRAPRWRPPPP